MIRNHCDAKILFFWIILTCFFSNWSDRLSETLYFQRTLICLLSVRKFQSVLIYAEYCTFSSLFILRKYIMNCFLWGLIALCTKKIEFSSIHVLFSLSYFTPRLICYSKPANVSLSDQHLEHMLLSKGWNNYTSYT